MTYTVYDSVTGQILYTIFGDNDAVVDSLSNTSYIVGEYNDQDHYVDLNTLTVINKPTCPSNNHIWNLTDKNWTLDISKLSTSIRQQRNALLLMIDKINPIWYSSLSNEQQTELRTYRQALLDVPQQISFPTTIDWPIKPSWL